MNPSIFLRAAELQDEQNRVNPRGSCNFSCWNINKALGVTNDVKSNERIFYENLFGCSSPHIFNTLLWKFEPPPPDYLENLNDCSSYSKKNCALSNEIRVLALLLAYEVAKDEKRRLDRRKRA